MDIKRLSPQNLFLRFLVTFLIILLMNMRESASLESLFIFSLAEVFIFSILMMLFYLIMVQYLMKKSKLRFTEALVCRFANWPINLICLGFMSCIFRLSWSLSVMLITWLLCESAVYLAQKLLGPQRRSEDGR